MLRSIFYKIYSDLTEEKFRRHSDAAHSRPKNRKLKNRPTATVRRIGVYFSQIFKKYQKNQLFNFLANFFLIY